MVQSVFARRRQIAIVGTILLLGIVAVILIFVTGKTKPIVQTPIVPEYVYKDDGEDEELSLGPAPMEIPKGRFVRLEQTIAYDENDTGNEDDKYKILNLAELEVFDVNGTNLAAGKTVTGSSENLAYGYMNLTDGDKTNVAATLGESQTVYDFMTVDLGAEEEISRIVITNRNDCCKNRAIGIKVVILAADGTSVVKETPIITTVADTYTIGFKGNTWIT